MTTTDLTKPEVRELPALDSQAASADADTWVTTQLADAPLEPVEWARATNKLVERLSADYAAAMADRNAAAWTLHTHYRVRRGASIPAALGVGRARWQTIREEQARINPAAVADAPAVLPALATRAAQIHARLHAAVEIRRQAIAALSDAGMSGAEIGRQLGRNAGRISHIRAATKAAS